MKGVIIETGRLAATGADLLTATRLQTAPADGSMLFQVQASDNDGTNNYAIDIQMPDSDVPLISQNVPMGRTAGLGGQLDADMMFQFVAQITQGGRVVFGLTETGDAECEWRVIFTPTAPARRRPR